MERIRIPETSEEKREAIIGLFFEVGRYLFLIDQLSGLGLEEIAKPLGIWIHRAAESLGVDGNELYREVTHRIRGTDGNGTKVDNGGQFE